MLDDYKDSQRLAYSLVRNVLISEGISHAYLINTNNYPFAFDFVLAMVKSFLCPKHFVSNNSCSDCSLCKRIDEGNFPELKIIDSDGMWIKKNQILDLQEEFSKIAIEGKKRVYIIKNADRMNQQTSNSILKFLEEPSNDVIAILMTDNFNKMLKTIVSRCQVINLNNVLESGKSSIENFAYVSCDSSLSYNDFISNNDNKKFIDDVLEFIDYYEKNGNDVIVYSKQYWHSKFKEKSDLLKVFDLLINFYSDVLFYLMVGKVNFYTDYVDKIKDIAEYNDISKILDKISVCIEYKDKLKFNVNLNLFFDKFIIELGGKYGEICRS